MTKIRPVIISVLMLAFAPGLAYAMPWSWDMFSQPSHRAQKDPAPLTPAGIVPATGAPADAKDRAGAARLKNPKAPDAVSIERGRGQFNTYCLPCHGEGGKGDGLVGQKFVAPTDLTSDYVQTKPDGDIYYTITHGGLAVMPPYDDSMSPEDRWHIVNYIKHGLVTKGGK